MTSGHVTLNGVTDQQLVTVLQAKIKHEGVLQFNPQAMTLGQANPPRPNVTINNNVVLTWNNDDGYRAALGLMAELGGHPLTAKETL